MPKPYSQDLRERVVGAVEAGASCHEAAAAFEVSVSSAIRWTARWRRDRIGGGQADGRQALAA